MVATPHGRDRLPSPLPTLQGTLVVLPTQLGDAGTIRTPNHDALGNASSPFVQLAMAGRKTQEKAVCLFKPHWESRSIQIEQKGNWLEPHLVRHFHDLVSVEVSLSTLIPPMGDTLDWPTE